MKKAQKIIHDKFIDYYDVILEQEKKSHELAQDRETSPEKRRENMIERVVNLDRIGRDK